MRISAAPGEGVPYWRLSSVYFFYFAVLGALLPYWTLYLKDRGFDAREIGWLSAILVSTRIIAPNIWGWLADHTRQRLRIIRFGALTGFLAFTGVFVADGFSQLALALFGFSFFWNAILAQFEVLTLNCLGDERHNYSRIRLWGSLGFILAVVALGFLFDFLPIGYLPVFIAGFLLLIWFGCMMLPNQPQAMVVSDSTPLSGILSQRAVLFFLAVTVLLQVSHAPYYVFFTLYLDAHNYSRTLAGQLWALGVIAEIGLFIYMRQVITRFSIRAIMIFSLLATCLRWVLTAFFITHLPILIFAQCLHAFSFGSMHACSIEVVQRYFSAGHAGKGQAIYSATSFGLGSAIGASIAGYLWADLGAAITFLFGAGVALLALVLAWLGFTSNQFK